MFWKYLSIASENTIYLNLCLPNPTQGTEDTKCILTCVKKPVPCQRGIEMHLKMCWSNLSHASKDTKYISTCMVQYPMIAWSQNISQLVLKILIAWLGGHKIYFNLCWTTSSPDNASQHVLSNPCHASKDTRWINICVDQTPPLPARTQNASHWVLTKLLCWLLS